MPSSRWIVGTAFVIGALAGLAVGCQVYDFEPVKPLVVGQTTVEREVIAKNLKPNLMLLVDKSGSMDLPADPTNSNCRIALSDGGSITCGGTKGTLCNPATCPTRWSELQGAMNDFLTNSGDVARMGLSTFPATIYCGEQDPDAGWNGVVKTFPPIVQTDDVTADLVAQAGLINERLQMISSTGNANTDLTTTGGTPTAGSLRILSTRADLNDPTRDDFVLLLTDGLPNCNKDNPYNGSSPNCRCTVLQADGGSVCAAGGSGGYQYVLGCLDQDGTVNQISSNLSKGLKTIVVGFGSDTVSGDAPTVLEAMAEAGGFPRQCPDGGGCAAGDTCNMTSKPYICNNVRYYQASNRAELTTALAEIGNIIGPDPCLYPLVQDPPGGDGGDHSLLGVYITESGKPTVKLVEGPDTYSYTPGTVTLLGATCALVSNATPANPVKVEVKVISTL